ncbi:hypothetical protein G0Q06_10090 [Puniceicoccales bacterium CK1056]|uniref:Uncharacterized protein n=1 Tax=Oceanipulchritudo coccoides TaxID=2706888 RepID=A0A6B2M560_9BACT|nr:right-handed parallel beta-helix repeat-containing protein [Oceanipulchritudo coccoides]NDV62800.1 hypothetical protein [Oceanipulchritudo coccoides]
MSQKTRYIFYINVFLLAVASLTGAGISDFVGEFDTEYLRMKCAWKGNYLYGDNSTSLVRWEESRDLRELDTHWYLQESGTAGEYWIRSRPTGQAMHVAGQTGEVQFGSLNTGDPAYRWIFEQDGGIFRIRSAEIANQYLSTEIETDNILDYAGLVTGWLSQQFIVEPIDRGATLPWLSYDEDNYSSLVAPAYIESVSYASEAAFNRDLAASEAQKLACIVLDAEGTSVSWVIQESANAAVIRYSLQDGDAGNITLTITPGGGGGSTSTNVPVTSAQTWVYFDGGTEYDSPAPGRIPAKRFAEARVLLSTPVDAGDTLTISRETGDELIWIDVVELETANEFIPANPGDYYYVTSFGAVPNDSGDDYYNFLNCLTAADAAGKKVYVPAGRYNLSDRLELPSGAHLQGAGMWYTDLVFTSTTPGDGNGGVYAMGDNRTLSDVYITGPQTTRDGGYKGIQGSWGTGSLIENVWVENTATGVWTADFNAPILVTDGLIVRNSRFRNIYADGINMSSGTINSIVENCHFRSNGDDALASWAAGQTNGAGPTTNQQFRYNTIECIYRAGGIGLFGGGAHKVHHNVVSDQYTGAGIRLNTIFIWVDGIQKGYPFNSTGDPIRIYDNTLIRTGARGLFGGEIAAIDMVTEDDDMINVEFRNITIDGSLFSGIRFNGQFSTYASNPVYSNIVLENIIMDNVPVGTVASGLANGTVDYLNVSALLPATEFSLVGAFSINYTTATEAWQTIWFGSPTAPNADLALDPNLNGLVNLQEFAFLNDPVTGGPLAGLSPASSIYQSGGQSYLQMDYRRRVGEGLGNAINGYHVDGIIYTPELSSTLEEGSWQSGSAAFQQIGKARWNGDGTESVTIRSVSPLSGGSKFARLKVDLLGTNPPPPPPESVTLLIDFGNDSSFRGASVSSPDLNGNHWTSVWSGSFYTNLVDLNGDPSSIDLGFSTATGTDYYNGPSGVTQDPAACVYVASSLGELGVDEAVYDYYVSPVFQIQGLNPAKTYDLTFFGSHKFNSAGNDSTVFTIYTDSSLTTAVASTSLLVGAGASHNQDTVVTLSGLSPQTGNILYVEVLGASGGNGYLNALKITENP